MLTFQHELDILIKVEFFYGIRDNYIKCKLTAQYFIIFIYHISNKTIMFVKNVYEILGGESIRYFLKFCAFESLSHITHKYVMYPFYMVVVM